MPTVTAAPSLAYAELSNLAPPADRKHSADTLSAPQETALRKLASLARGTDRQVATEAIEVLMNSAALGASSRPLSERAVCILEAIHEDGKAHRHAQAAIRQQAQALCDYAHLAGDPAQSARLLPQAIQSMAAHAAADTDASALHRQFKAEAPRQASVVASAPLPASTPEFVRAALTGLQRVQVIGVVDAPSQVSKKEFRTVMGQAVARLIHQDVPDEIAGQPRALIVRVEGKQGAPDRWGALVACRSHDAPQKQDILFLHSATVHPDPLSHRLTRWLTESFPNFIHHVGVAGVDRGKSLPDDAGLFLVHMLRQLDQSLLQDQPGVAPKTDRVKMQLDDQVVTWGALPRARQVEALAGLSGTAAPLERRAPAVTASSAHPWWLA